MPDPLPDDASCRIIAAHPRLDEAAAGALVAALDRLFAQFAREDRLERWSCSAECDGAVVVLAWTPGRALSGCSYDKIAGVLARHEGLSNSALLAPPPICIRLDGGWTCVDRAGLRARATPATPLLDVRIGRLGDWRSRGSTTVGASWASGLLVRPAGAASPA